MAYRILIVDDSSVVRKVMRKTLGLSGLDIDELLEAEHGATALELLKKDWVDIVFLDINMPVMNGIEFMEHLHADNDLSRTPVVVVSTEGSVERKERLQQLGIREYLRKPTTPEEILNTVQRVLGTTIKA